MSVDEMLYFDRKGIIPPKGMDDPDTFLSYAAERLRFWEDYKANPEKIWGPGARIAHVEDSVLQRFEQRFETEALPVTYVPSPNLVKHYAGWNPGKRLVLAFALRTADALTLDKDGISYPLILPWGNDTDRLYVHENLHGIRGNWSQTKRNSLVEEMMAGSAHLAKVDGKKIYKDGINRTLESSVGCALASLFLAYNAITTYPPGILTPVLMAGAYVSMTIMPLRKNLKLMDMAAAEGINYDYLFLRASPGEFSLELPLERQIAGKQGLKWDIMRAKLGLSYQALPETPTIAEKLAKPIEDFALALAGQASGVVQNLAAPIGERRNRQILEAALRQALETGNYKILPWDFLESISPSA